MKSNSKIGIGALFVHFSRNGEFVANGDVLFDRDNPLVLGPGRSELRAVLKPINLQAGRYTISMAAFDETRKLTILHSLHFAEVEIQGPVGGGPSYLVPMTVNVSNAVEADDGLISFDANTGTRC